MDNFSNILNGSNVAKDIENKIKKEVIELIKRGARSPRLAVICISDDGSSDLYVKNIKNACSKVGISIDCYFLSKNVQTEELISIIKKLNHDAIVDGIQLCLPLPKHIDSSAVIETIDPNKDVDSIHPNNLGKIMQGAPNFQSCAAKGMMLLFDSIRYALKGKHAVVVGASHAGKPIALSLLHAGCTVSICNIYTPDLCHIVSQADVLISAVGQAGLIKGAWIKKGAIVIDMGVTLLPNGTVEGDVEVEVARENAAWITPVSGGLGPITVAVLLQNTIESFKKNISFFARQKF